MLIIVHRGYKKFPIAPTAKLCLGIRSDIKRLRGKPTEKAANIAVGF